MEADHRKQNTETGRSSCLDLEAVLTQYAEGSLPETERGSVETHLARCSACTGALEEMRLALALCRRAEEMAPPPRLVARILEQTIGKLSWKQRLRLWVRPALQPRLAMGLAMALISFSIVLNASGMSLRKLSLADLSPSRIYLQLDRQAHLAGTRAMKYYQDLRIVYEIQTQLQAIRDTAAPPEEPRQQPQKQQPPPRAPAHNKWSRQTTYLAAGIF